MYVLILISYTECGRLFLFDSLLYLKQTSPLFSLGNLKDQWEYSLDDLMNEINYINIHHVARCLLEIQVTSLQNNNITLGQGSLFDGKGGRYMLIYGQSKTSRAEFRNNDYQIFRNITVNWTNF